MVPLCMWLYPAFRTGLMAFDSVNVLKIRWRILLGVQASKRCHGAQESRPPLTRQWDILMRRRVLRITSTLGPGTTRKA